MMHSLHRVLALLVLAFAGAACSFEAPPSEGALTTNKCSYSEECGSDAVCNGSMCVARTVSDSLRVYLHVAPLQQLDGPIPVATMLDSFEVTSGTDAHSWTLPAPVRVRGKVRDGVSVVDADVTFTAAPSIPGLPAKVVTTSVAGGGRDEPQYDFDIRVAEPGEYTVRVEPKDTTLPPHEQVVEIDADYIFRVSYSELVERTFLFGGEMDDRPLVVRAHDIATGAPISSTAEVVNSQAKLNFMAEPEAFRLVVRPVGAYDPEGLSNADGCDHDTPVLPTLSIDSSELTEDDDGALHVELPPVPARVSVSGRVELCDARSLDGAEDPARLPITLRSTAVELDDPSGRWTAQVATDTEAVRQGLSRDYEYCVDVFQGKYDVVVTPPESKPCEIYAKSDVTLTSEDGSKGTAPMARLETAAQLVGDLRTTDLMPLVATTVEVQSLGRLVKLKPADAALTTFSRSRQTTTDETGAFRVAVDRGSYDVTIKPPSGSGYAWYVRRDVEIGGLKEFTNDVDMSSPVAIDCRISYAEGAKGDSVSGADITAYTVISDAVLGERAIAIGKAVADESGQFMLLLPPKVLYGWSSSGVEP